MSDYMCKRCRISWDSKQELVSHWLETRHAYYCTTCKDGLGSVESLLEHDCSPVWRCHVCRMTAPSHAIYARHWEDTINDARHEDENPFQSGTSCQDMGCRSDFKTRDLLRSHLRQNNGCLICHLHFRNDNNLRMVRICYCNSHDMC